MKDDSDRGALPILNVENLTVFRGKYRAVESVSFRVFPGSNTAIVGPNGAGKSTLIQGILGLIPYESGRIEILGKELKKLGKHWQQIAYIPQKFPFDRSFPLTVAELVTLGWPERVFFRSRQRKMAVEKVLVQVNLEQQAKQSIGTLSGGELKRVLLAYSLVTPRKLLVLDEAMAGVDATGEAEFAELLSWLQREEGFSILQVSHDLDMVSSYCDRVLCINRSLSCQGKPSLALSPENLNQIYGDTLTRYFHNH
jgi:zinc/manganese transport system ATP-binding protein